MRIFHCTLTTILFCRGIMTSKVDDHRSDDEGDDEDVQDQKEE